MLSPFEEQDVDLRCYPEKLLSGAKTIICFAMGYLINSYDLEEVSKGKISRYAQIKDYHFVVKEKLDKVVDFISTKKEGSFKVFVDTGSILEKAAAQRAGLGWIGENTCLFTEKFGSWVFLGEVLTDIYVEPDEPAKNRCNHCGKCIKACPTGALIEPYNINPYKCLSYITQMRGNIPLEFRKALGNRIFGCDTCQEACPQNRDVKIPVHEEFLPNKSPETDLLKLLQITRGDFREKFSDIAAGWRGRNTLRRNAACAMGNTQEKYFIKTLKQLAEKELSPVVREHMIWAIKQLKDSSS